MVFLTFLIGLAILIFGADLLVKGSVGLANRLRISPLVIGLTVVAFGTSSPELVVSIKSVLSGQHDIALGNVIGSNVFNVLFILGISALICPLVVSRQLLRLDIPFMLGAVLLAFGLALDGSLNQIEGGILILAGMGYTVWTVIAGKKEACSASETAVESEKINRSVFFDIVMLFAGLAGLVVGAQMFVGAAVDIARSLGVSELVIALTLVAAGTSLPEVAASIMAALRGERDMAIGNVVGSNIYNLFFILGGSSVAAGSAGLEVASSILSFDFMILAAVSLACVPILFSHYEIDRWEGALFLLYYGFYTAYLILKCSNHDSLPYFSAALIYFMIPMSLIIIASILWSSHRSAGSVNSGRRV